MARLLPQHVEWGEAVEATQALIWKHFSGREPKAPHRGEGCPRHTPRIVAEHMQATISPERKMGGGVEWETALSLPWTTLGWQAGATARALLARRRGGLAWRRESRPLPPPPCEACVASHRLRSARVTERAEQRRGGGVAPGKAGAGAQQSVSGYRVVRQQRRGGASPARPPASSASQPRASHALGPLHRRPKSKA